MRVLLVHNYYQQPGGEDQVFSDEGRLLASRGHAVTRFTAHNDRVRATNAVALAMGTVWNQSAYRAIRALVRRGHIDVVHVHNSFPMISPAVYYAARAEGAAVVQTLHNYRLFCPNGQFFRAGRVCQDCLGRMAPWPGVAHACYRGSRAASAVSAAMLATHNAIRTWSRAVDAYVALTEFARGRCIAAGLPPDRIHVKPNFVDPDPGAARGERTGFLFVGRLSPEKGVRTLLRAWELVRGAGRLRIVGDGPLRGEVEEAATRLPDLEYLGFRPVTEVRALMGEALALVLPSEWYETFGRVAVEAFARATPVIASEIGAVAEVVKEGETGLRVRAGDATALANSLRWAQENPAALAAMGQAARQEFEARYTADQNYDLMMRIYAQAIDRAHSDARREPSC